MHASGLEHEQRGKLKGWHVGLWMLGFFAVIFAVNGVFLYYALSTHPGVVIEHSYLQGLNYNQTLEANARQAELGWSAEIGMVHEGGANMLIVRIKDRNSAPVSYMDVKASVRHTSSKKDDREVVLKPVGEDEYQVSLDGLSSGVWRVHVKTYGPGKGEAVFEAHKTIGIR